MKNIDSHDISPTPASPEQFIRMFLKHHARYQFTEMHEFSFRQYAERHARKLPHRSVRRLAIAAPRGSAKSTVHTLILPLMDIVHLRERHIIIISATQQQAVNRLANITRELKSNCALHQAFFQGEPPQMQATKRSLIINDIKVEAFGCGSEMRGISHGEFRPTHIILDDVEASRVALVEYRRRQLIEWYDEVVENLGDTYTHITIVGTILHPKSLLSILLERPGFTGQIYRSVIRWSTRNDLWGTWRRMCLDHGDPDREATAERFFADNRAAMLEGTEVLWPQKESYLDLQKLHLTIGRAAFSKEKQNRPLNSGFRVFDTLRWTRFISPNEQIELVKPPLAQMIAYGGEADPGNNDDHLPAYMTETTAGNSGDLPKTTDLKYFGFLDPALGRSRTRDGDYAAIVTIGRDVKGICYVVDVWMKKVPPSEQIEMAFALHSTYNYSLFGYESNGFQETLGKELKKQVKKRYERGISTHLPLRPRENTDNKHARIALLEPPITAGLIRFQQNLPEEFFTQADEFGTPRCHDDALDALASCYQMICELHTNPNPIRTIRRKSKGSF